MVNKPRGCRLDQIDVQDLLKVRAIAEHGSISRSAVAMSMSQPNLTRRIHKLEVALGHKILQRSLTGVSLSSFGQKIVEHTRTIEDALAAIVNIAKNAHSEQVRLGATHLPVALIVPQLMEACNETHSNIERVKQTSQIHGAVSANDPKRTWRVGAILRASCA